MKARTREEGKVEGEAWLENAKKGTQMGQQINRQTNGQSTSK